MTGRPDDQMTESFADDWPYGIFLSQVIDPNDLQSTGHYIPYIFMEWNGESETCGDLASSLLSIGYTPWYKCQQGSVHKIYVDI